MLTHFAALKQKLQEKDADIRGVFYANWTQHGLQSHLPLKWLVVKFESIWRGLFHPQLVVFVPAELLGGESAALRALSPADGSIADCLSGGGQFSAVGCGANSPPPHPLSVSDTEC